MTPTPKDRYTYTRIDTKLGNFSKLIDLLTQKSHTNGGIIILRINFQPLKSKLLI